MTFSDSNKIKAVRFIDIYLTKFDKKATMMIGYIFIFFSVLCSLAYYQDVDMHKKHHMLVKNGIIVPALVCGKRTEKNYNPESGITTYRTYISYQFKDSNNNVVIKEEEVSNTDGMTDIMRKENDTVYIRYLEKNPSVSEIIGNTFSLRYSRISTVILFVFLFATLTFIFYLIKKTLAIVNLYKYGLKTKGIILSKKYKMFTDDFGYIEISYKFQDDQGMEHTVNEKSIKYAASVKKPRAVELMDNLIEGGVVTVVYKQNNPVQNTIFYAV